MADKVEHIENSEAFKSLKVKKGVSDAEDINSNAVQKFKKIKRPLLSAEAYFDGIRQGDIAFLSKAITLVESTSPQHQALADKIINLCLPYSGKSKRIGITGVPGVGKSTFIENFGVKLVEKGHKICILAIDPSSEKSKGSILGDKTRMEELVKSKKAFIRPSPSSGSLGGVARKTRESIILCEAAGYDTVLIETVGVGQSETAVHSMCDFFLLLMLAGAGDELQGIKRGIMEMADTIAITKADGDNKIKAITAEGQYKNALHLFPASDNEWETKVLSCSSMTSFGIDNLWQHINDFFELTSGNGELEKKRLTQAQYWMHESIKEKLMNHLYKNPKNLELIRTLEQDILDNKISPFTAADQIFGEYINSSNR